MPYWEYEFRMDEINKTIAEEKKEQEGKSDSIEAVKDPNAFMRNTQRQYMQNMSKFSAFNTPRMPKISSVPKI